MSGIDAYKKALNQTGSSRNAEYRLLAQVTAALIDAQETAGDMKKNPTKCKSWLKLLTGIMRYGQRLWKIAEVRIINYLRS